MKTQFTKKIQILSSCALLFAGSFAGAEQTLTLEEVLSHVESTNLSALAARESVVQAVESVRSARAGLLPNAQLVAGQSRVQTVMLGLDLASFGMDRRMDPYNHFNAAVTVSIPLVDMTSIAMYKESKHVAEISQYEYDAAIEEIKLVAAQAFIGGLRTREALDLADKSLKRSEELRNLVADRVEAGANNPIDLSRAELEVSTAKQNIIDRQTDVYNGDQQLKLILNMDLRSKLDPRTINIDTDTALPKQPNVDMRDVLTKRNDYLASMRQEDCAKLLVKAADWQRLPSLNVSGNFGYTTEEAFDGEEDSDWMVGLSVSVPIFEGFRTKADKAMAKAHLRGVERRVEEVTQQIESDVLVAWENLQAAYSRLALGKKNLSFAETTYKYALDRFRNGMGDNRELIEAQHGLNASEANLLDLRLQLAMSHLNFAFACGSVDDVLNYAGS